MAKPIGPICNLDCEYCYYLHKEDLYPGTKSWRMPRPTLETYIRQLIDAQPPEADEVTFAWQGGEPTLLGLEFFRDIVAIQRKYSRPRQRIANALQTNGILLDDDWAAFLKEHQFLVGLSIDGPKDLHDCHRLDKKGEGTFDSVLRALQLLRRTGVPFNALVVVNRRNGDHGKRVYTYLRDNGVEHMQLSPLVEPTAGGRHPDPQSCSPALNSDQHDWDHVVSSRSVRPEQFGRFLIDVFEEWIRRDVGRVFVQTFDQALAAWLGHEPSLCVFRKHCGRSLAVEHNGDMYSCDHFVEPEYRLGNIHDLPIVELANSPRQASFGAAKETTLPQYCRDCEVRFACHGECPKNRLIETPGGEPGLNYLCAGYRAFFNHIDGSMRLMVRELRQGRAAANVMRQIRNPAPSLDQGGRRVRSADQSPRRNDFCPCGSGRKFKKCCGAE